MMPILAIALQSAAAGSAGNWDEEVRLFGAAAAASEYADVEYHCRGFSARSAREKANRALGADFRTRLSAAAEKLEKKVGQKRVEEVSIFVMPAIQLTPEYCRKTKGLVPKAHEALVDLENRLGAE